MLNYFVIFSISLLAISLELFFTRILNLKTWNHVVYVVIPFAILGYGIGANAFLIFKDKIKKYQPKAVMTALLLLLAAGAIISTILLIKLPINVQSIVKLLNNVHESAGQLLIGYTIVMAPFVIIGFLCVYLFSFAPSQNPQGLTCPSISRLYFWDMLGAGFGAFIFFFLINRLAVFHSIVFLCVLMLISFLYFILPKPRWLITAAVSFLCWLIFFSAALEPYDYKIDKSKGWEWIPGYFSTANYKMLFSKWHPLGRTDIFTITNPKTRERIFEKSFGTFEINAVPFPEFSYIVNNFLAGTPIYKLSKEGLEESSSQVSLFSQAFEAPYTILKEPYVVAIGAGGGRDIFMAKTHGAKKIIGAEINPAICSVMSRGGEFYEYSGRVYDSDGTKVFNVDGRHLVKTLKPDSVDLIVLNGVDTLSGLSIGAYSYAESYLYTKDAIVDYLNILKKDGMVYLNRWLFLPYPRETLRLFAISLEALRSKGIKKPWEHIIVGGPHAGKEPGWSLVFIKKTPFTIEEKTVLKEYFRSHDVPLMFPTEHWENKTGKVTFFDLYAQRFIEGKEKEFARGYPFDISVITDDAPFFYKYDKLKFFSPFEVFSVHHVGTVIYMTQLLVLLQAALFIALFIFLPLLIFKVRGIKGLDKKQLTTFIAYFSCLGLGFMFIEIPIIQRFVLLLGTPIHSISVTLACLLIFTGLGSFLSAYLDKAAIAKDRIVAAITAILVMYLVVNVSAGARIINCFMGLHFAWRVLAVGIMLLPLGLCLGVFFPTGLQLIGKGHGEAIAWAWGINCGFTVLGSILAIILGQYIGFNAIILLAALTYIMGAFAFHFMQRYFAGEP